MKHQINFYQEIVIVYLQTQSFHSNKTDHRLLFESIDISGCKSIWLHQEKLIYTETQNKSCYFI